MKKIILILCFVSLNISAQITVNGSNFTNLTNAKNYVRTINDNMNSDIIVSISPGTYTLTETLEFTHEDSGTNGYNIIYQATDPNNKPVISGGQQITGWTPHNATENIWEANIENLYSRQLYVNGERGIRARSEDDFGLVETTSGYIKTCNNIDFSNWNNENIKDLEVVSNLNWVSTRIPISYANKIQLCVEQNLWNDLRSQWNVNSVPCTRIENAYELIDVENEWYIDRLTTPNENKIYLKSNQEPTEIIIPRIDKFINANNLKNIKFNNLIFKYSSWTEPSNYINSKDRNNGLKTVQSNIFQGFSDQINFYLSTIEGSLTFKNSSNIFITNSEFYHIGSTAIDINTGSKNNIICNNIINDISGCGISMGSLNAYNYFRYTPDSDIDNQFLHSLMVSNNIISNNLIENIGKDYHSCASINISYSNNSTINNNTLSNFQWSGISLAEFNWDNIDNMGTTINQNKVVYLGHNYITNNKIDCSNASMIDSGGIYTMGSQGLNLNDTTKSVISGNYILNQKYYLAPIYLDAYSRNFNVFNNLVDTNLLIEEIIKICYPLDDYNVYSIAYWNHSDNITISNNSYNDLYLDPPNSQNSLNGCRIGPCTGNVVNNNFSFSGFSNHNQNTIIANSGVQPNFNCD